MKALNVSLRELRDEHSDLLSHNRQIDFVKKETGRQVEIEKLDERIKFAKTPSMQKQLEDQRNALRSTTVTGTGWIGCQDKGVVPKGQSPIYPTKIDI